MSMSPSPPDQTAKDREASASARLPAPDAEAKPEKRPMRLSGWMAAVMDQLEDEGRATPPPPDASPAQPRGKR
jgi:hypothetical protein